MRLLGSGDRVVASVAPLAPVAEDADDLADGAEATWVPDDDAA